MKTKTTTKKKNLVTKNNLTIKNNTHTSFYLRFIFEQKFVMLYIYVRDCV